MNSTFPRYFPQKAHSSRYQRKDSPSSQTRTTGTVGNSKGTSTNITAESNSSTTSTPNPTEPPPHSLTHPTGNHHFPSCEDLICADRRALRTYRPPADVPDNLTGAKCRALKELTQHPNIIIRMADKGSKIVILDRQQYLLEANRQLLDTKYYKPIPESIQPDTQTKLRTIITSLHDNRQITAKQRDFLFGPDDPRPRHFYLLPKMHKDPQTWTVPFEVPHGRPIVSDCNSCS